MYLLTPRGIEEKAHITANFLKRKMAEYEQLKQEILKLMRSVDVVTATSAIEKDYAVSSLVLKQAAVKTTK